MVPIRGNVLGNQSSRGQSLPNHRLNRSLGAGQTRNSSQAIKCYTTYNICNILANTRVGGSRIGQSSTTRSHATVAAAKKQNTGTTDPLTGTSWSYGSTEALGPAYEATLRMLEWPRLCRHISQFAQTSLGQKACNVMRPLASQAACEAALTETRAVDVLESEFAAELDFGGLQSDYAETALNRSAKGGMLSGQQLQAVASVLMGAAKLQRTIKAAAREADGGAIAAVIEPIVKAFRDIATLPGLAADIGFAIDDDGRVREAASDPVKRASARVRTVEGRLRGILKGHAGEVTEYGNRLCVAVPTSNDSSPPKGILLGSSPGGGIWYIEPPAAVPLNNDLAAARGELIAAEETVLWSLTQKVSDSSYDLLCTLRTLTWLDVTASKARYGRWVNGYLPQFSSFPKTGKSRGGSRKNSSTSSSSLTSGTDGGLIGEDAFASFEGNNGGLSDSASATSSPAHLNNSTIEGLFLSLRRLRHPLLLGDHLLAMQSAEKERRRSNSSSNQGGLRTATAVKVAKKTGSKKSSSGAYSSGSDSDSNDGGSSSDGEYASSNISSTSNTSGSTSPVPVDMVVGPGTRAVVITGPNTGGKTAGVKALGLCVLMAKCGVPLPAAEPAVLPCFDAVLADIGDEQSLSANLSTFSGHLRRIEALRRESTGKSLVMLDELGTGTDPTEGSALGMALLERMVKGGPGGAGLVIATTHHSALTTLKYEESGPAAGKFENASVEFDDVALAPTYRLLWGIPGRSNALNIAERLGLDSVLVGEARERLGEAAEKVNNIIIDLEELKRRYEQDTNAAENAEEELAKLQKKIKEKRRQLAEKKLLADMQESQAAVAAVRAARADLQLAAQEQHRKSSKDSQQRSEAEQKAQDVAALNAQLAARWTPKVGDQVFLPRLQKNVKVVGVDKVSGQVSLQVGMMKVSASLEEIRQRN